MSKRILKIMALIALSTISACQQQGTSRFSELEITFVNEIVTGLSTSYNSYNSFYLYYDSARKSRINSTTYRLYAYGPTDNTTITVGSMLSADLIYFYNTTRRTTVGLSIEDLEEGGHTLKTN